MKILPAPQGFQEYRCANPNSTSAQGGGVKLPTTIGATGDALARAVKDLERLCRDLGFLAALPTGPAPSSPSQRLDCPALHHDLQNDTWSSVYQSVTGPASLTCLGYQKSAISCELLGWKVQVLPSVSLEPESSSVACIGSGEDLKDDPSRLPSSNWIGNGDLKASGGMENEDGSQGNPRLVTVQGLEEFGITRAVELYGSGSTDRIIEYEVHPRTSEAAGTSDAVVVQCLL